MVKKTESKDSNLNEIPERPSPVGKSYESFRPTVVVDKITAYLDKYQEPGYVYKGVIMNYKHAPLTRNVVEHEAKGYEIVYTTHQFTDQRAFAPDAEKRDASVPSPVIKTSADGYQYILMRISEERFNKNQIERSKLDHDKYLRSVKRVHKDKDGNMHTDGGFINNNGDK